MPSSEELDISRRRLLYRCWHRGTREMDLLVGRFAESRIAQMGERELADLEEILEVDEKELFAWLTETMAAPVGFENGLLGEIRRFHAEHPVSGS